MRILFRDDKQKKSMSMNVSILISHCGIWESNILYSQYKSDKIIVGDNISFINLKAAIASELGIRKKIIIRYIIEGNSSPIIISNDMGMNCMLK